MSGTPGAWIRRGVLVALLVATGLILSTVDRADPDLWGHVRYGEDVLDSGRLPETATYTYTAPRQRWINHENLSELALGWVAREAGGAGLGALKCGLGLVTIGTVLAAAAGQGVGIVATSGIALVVAFAIAPGWSFRPQLFSYVAFAILLFVLERSERGRPRGARSPLVWVVVPLFAVWANTHGGFVAGLAAVAVFLGIRALETLVKDGWAGVPSAARDGAVVAAAALATLVNPYGAELPVWLLADLLPPRPEIYEWGALGTDPATLRLFVMLGGAVAVTWWRTRRPLDLAATAVLLGTAYQTVLHVRHIPFCALAAGFWLVAHANGSAAEPAPITDAAPRARRALAPLLVADALLVGLLAVSVHGPKVERSLYPVSAFRFMAKRGLVGRTVVHFDWAQYAIAAFGASVPVAFDGRLRTCYPQEVADAYFDFLVGDRLIPRWRSAASPPVDPVRILDLGAPELVVVARHFPHAADVVASQPGWVLLYQDGVAQVWGRGSKYDDPASPAYLPATERWITEARQTGSVPWPALPARRMLAETASRRTPA